MDKAKGKTSNLDWDNASINERRRWLNIAGVKSPTDSWLYSSWEDLSMAARLSAIVSRREWKETHGLS